MLTEVHVQTCAAEPKKKRSETANDAGRDVNAGKACRSALGSSPLDRSGPAVTSDGPGRRIAPGGACLREKR